jgi:hypothetical protein
MRLTFLSFNASTVSIVSKSRQTSLFVQTPEDKYPIRIDTSPRFKMWYSFYHYDDSIYFFLDRSLFPCDLFASRDSKEEAAYKKRIIDDNPKCVVHTIEGVFSGILIRLPTPCPSSLDPSIYELLITIEQCIDNLRSSLKIPRSYQYHARVS